MATSPDLPRPVKNAAEIAKLAAGIGTAFLAQLSPEAAFAAPFINYFIDRSIKRAQTILLDKIRAGSIELLTDEQTAAFIPMVYRFLEAAKEGEYEHNLKILGAYIANELQKDIPDPGSFTRMASRIEALSKLELKVIALINTSLSSITRISPDAIQGERPYVSAQQLSSAPGNKDGLNQFQIAEVLADLSARGLLIPDPATRAGKAEEYHYTTSSFSDLIERAKDNLAEQ